MSEPSTEQDPLGAATFPRERLHELLDEASVVRIRRERAQGWLLGIGLAVLVLGLPSERLWGDMALVRMTAGNGLTSTGILFPIASLLTRIPQIGAEQACFLISALAYGMLVPALLRLLRTIGFDHSLCLAAATATLLTPLLLVGASLPIDFAPGALGATWLLASLFQPREKVKGGYQWRAASLFFVAVLLRSENALLLPAVIWAVCLQGGRSRGPVAGVALALAAGIALQVLIGENSRSFWDALLGGRTPSWSAQPQWLGYLALGLGACAFGLYALLLDPRLPEETPAPPWMVPWCLVVLAPVAVGSPEGGPVGAFLIPAAAVGLADWLTRRDRDDLVRRGIGVLVAAQLVLAVGARTAWELTDPDQDRRALLRGLLEPSDVVVTRDAKLSYWCSQRWGLTSTTDLAKLLSLRETPAGQAAEARAQITPRIVLLDPPVEGAILLQDRAVHVLKNEGLVRVEPGSAW